MEETLEHFSEDELYQLLEDARLSLNLVAIRDDCPDARTTCEWAALLGISETHMRRKLRGAVESGTWERVNVKRDYGGTPRIVPAYRIKRDGNGTDDRRDVE